MYVLVYIAAKPADVYAKINDFHHWEAWSPWLIMEKQAKVDINKEGKYYSWDGKRIGSGNMKITSENPNSVF